MDIGEKLQEELECRVAFTIPIGNGIPVPESCVITWVIMAVLVLASILLVRKLKKVPTGSQCLLEIAINWMNNFFLEILGPKGKRAYIYRCIEYNRSGRIKTSYEGYGRYRYFGYIRYTPYTVQRYQRKVTQRLASQFHRANAADAADEHT